MSDHSSSELVYDFSIFVSEKLMVSTNAMSSYRCCLLLPHRYLCFLTPSTWFSACSLPLLPLPEPRTYTSSCLRSLQLHKCKMTVSTPTADAPLPCRHTELRLLAVHVHTAGLRPLTNLHFQALIAKPSSGSSLWSQTGPLWPWVHPQLAPAFAACSGPHHYIYLQSASTTIQALAAGFCMPRVPVIHVVFPGP